MGEQEQITAATQSQGSGSRHSTGLRADGRREREGSIVAVATQRRGGNRRTGDMLAERGRTPIAQDPRRKGSETTWSMEGAVECINEERFSIIVRKCIGGTLGGVERLRKVELTPPRVVSQRTIHDQKEEGDDRSTLLIET